MWAVAGGHVDVVKLLLTHGADTSIQKHDGKAAVHIAAFKKHQQVITIQCIMDGRQLGDSFSP